MKRAANSTPAPIIITSVAGPPSANVSFSPVNMNQRHIAHNPSPVAITMDPMTFIIL